MEEEEPRGREFWLLVFGVAIVAALLAIVRAMVVEEDSFNNTGATFVFVLCFVIVRGVIIWARTKRDHKPREDEPTSRSGDD